MEITGDLSVSLEEETLIDMHSVLNVMNVIVYELITLSPKIGDPAVLTELHKTLTGMVARLKDPVEAHRQVENVDRFVLDFQDTLSRAVMESGCVSDGAVIGAIRNIHSIFEILEVRAREIVARQRNPHSWVEHNIRKLRNNFLSLFTAMERNSKGRYRIVHNLAEQGRGDYFLSFDIGSSAGTTVWMPAVFQDVIRDLLANARKYTEPGGMVLSGLHDSGESVRFVVTDTGLGIPVNEIQDVVTFGRRASNVSERTTRGGGFGLTKAYYVTRKYGGRMWIDSPVSNGGGTRIEIRIPHPVRHGVGPDQPGS